MPQQLYYYLDKIESRLFAIKVDEFIFDLQQVTIDVLLLDLTNDVSSNY
jgi:hypothetical protein